MGCTCGEKCPGATDCTCIEILSGAQCGCECSSKPIVLAPLALPPEEEIRLEAKNAELGNVAAILDRVSEAAVLVPAARLRERVDLSMERVSIGSAMEELGLVSGERGPEASAY
jgi:hypothetical protein